MKSSIAQRLIQLGVGLESAEVTSIPVEEPIIDASATEVMDTVALSDVQGEVVEAEGVLDRLQEDHSELTEVAAALESFLASSEPVSPLMASALAIPARRATKAYGLTNSIPSVESFGTSQEAIRANLKASLEATDSRLKQFVTWIKEVFKVMLEKVVAMWENFTSFITRQSDIAKSFIEMCAAEHVGLMADAANAIGDVKGKSNITIPAAVVAQLSLKGSYAGDLNSAYTRVADIAEGQLTKVCPLVMDVHADTMMALHEIMDEVRHSKSEADVQPLMARVAEMVSNMKTKMPDAFEKAANSLRDTEVKMGHLFFPELLGGIKFVVDLNDKTTAVSVSVDQMDVQNEELSVDPIPLNKITELCGEVVRVCKVIVDYQQSNSARKKMFQDLEKLMKEAEALRNDNAPTSGFTTGLTDTMSAALKTSIALERPLINYVTRVNRAVLHVCKLSLGAYSAGKENLGLPAPAQA